MDAFVIDRADGRDDGEDWTDDYQEYPAAPTSRSSSNPPESLGSGLGCTSIPTPKPSSSDADGRRSPSVRNNCRVAPDKFSSFRPILRTSSRPDPTGTRVYTSMPTPGSSPNGWNNRLRLEDTHNQSTRPRSIMASAAAAVPPQAQAARPKSAENEEARISPQHPGRTDRDGGHDQCHDQHAGTTRKLVLVEGLR